MAQKNETLPLLLALLITAGVLVGGWWWFKQKSGVDLSAVTSTGNKTENLPDTSASNKPSSLPSSPKTRSSSSELVTTFSFPNNVSQGTTIRVNGSTSMVQINQAIKRGFETTFTATTIATNAQGSDLGLELLRRGEIDIAAISRPLKPAEKDRGLNAVPIAKDAIAIVVGIDNPLRRGLKQNQVADIFQGRITNWSQLGRQGSPIRVINRPPISGTRQVFQDVVLKGSDFGTGANFTTLERDATTPILRALNNDGISYATYAQVANQKTVRTIAVEGLTPEAESYPYSRILYYAYQEPASLEVKAFLGYVLSPQGQQAITSGG